MLLREVYSEKEMGSRQLLGVDPLLVWQPRPPLPQHALHLSGSTPSPLRPFLGCLSPTKSQTDLGPLQHLPFVQHFHGKNLPTIPLPHHGNLRPQRALGSAQPGCKHPPPPPPGPLLTSPKAPRPITFKISKSSLCSRSSFTLVTKGLAEEIQSGA